MIKVRRFYSKSSFDLTRDIEDYIKFFKIEKSQIISINFIADKGLLYAFVTWESNE